MRNICKKNQTVKTVLIFYKKYNLLSMIVILLTIISKLYMVIMGDSNILYIFSTHNFAYRA